VIIASFSEGASDVVNNEPSQCHLVICAEDLIVLVVGMNKHHEYE
jgi:hypothetical protein